MLEAEDRGVQREPVMRPIGMRRQVRPIAAVAENRMIRLGEVNSDLIAAAGVELNSDQGRVGQDLLDLKMRDSVLTVIRVFHGMLAEPFTGGEITFKRAGFLFHPAGD